MRRTLPVLLVVAACSPKGTPPGEDTTTPATGGAAARGTAFLPGLDWGMTPDAAQAVYPDLDFVGENYQAETTLDGHEGVLTLTFGDDRLRETIFRASEGYASMDDCAPHFERWRTVLDAQLGPSSADNLEAEWKTDTGTANLSCMMDAGVGDEARLWLSTFPPDVDE